MSDSDPKLLPRWKCHKEVEAIKIVGVVGNMIMPIMGYAPFTVDESYLDKHKPEAGGYYVRYPDGYESFSPAEAFESGYTQIAGDWRGRVEEEKRELDEKMAKLAEFLKIERRPGSATWRLSAKQLDLLHSQISYMRVYSEILTERLQENA